MYTISAMLFYVETKVRIRDSKTATQEDKKKPINKLVNTDEVVTPVKWKMKQVLNLTVEELATLLQKLSTNSSNAAILSIVASILSVI